MKAPAQWRDVVISAIVPIFFYGAAFVWGTIYDQTRLEMWGFSASLFPLTAQQAYLEAIFPATSATLFPSLWAQEKLGLWYITLIVVPTVAAIALTRWFASSGLREHLRTLKAPTAPDQVTPATRKALHVGSFVMLFFSLPVVAGFAGALAILALIGPPYLFAQRDGARAWENAVYRSWTTATWVEDGNVTRTGYLERCTERWCAILTEQGEAIAIPAANVKRVTKTVKRDASAAASTATSTPSGK